MSCVRTFEVAVLHVLTLQVDQSVQNLLQNVHNVTPHQWPLLGMLLE